MMKTFTLYFPDGYFPQINPQVLSCLGINRDEFVLSVICSEQHISDDDPNDLYVAMDELKDELLVTPCDPSWLVLYEHDYLSVRHVLWMMLNRTDLQQFDRLSVYGNYSPSTGEILGYSVVLFLDT